MSVGCREEPFTEARDFYMYGTRFYWQYALWYMVPGMGYGRACCMARYMVHMVWYDVVYDMG